MTLIGLALVDSSYISLSSYFTKGSIYSMYTNLSAVYFHYVTELVRQNPGYW